MSQRSSSSGGLAATGATRPLRTPGLSMRALRGGVLTLLRSLDRERDDLLGRMGDSLRGGGVSDRFLRAAFICMSGCFLVIVMVFPFRFRNHQGM